MSSELLDLYRDAWLARARERGPAGRVTVDLPGVQGLLGCVEHPGAVVLVTDDRSHDLLRDLLRRVPAGTIQVAATAPRSLALLAGDSTWVVSSSTGMVCSALAPVPAVDLPDALRLRRVRRTDQDPPDRVPLADVVACAVRAAPQENPDDLAAFLSSGTAVRLFAALDARGEVRATSGYELTGDHARVLFVNTDPAWQRRGAGTAMTAAALLDARRRGAGAASLNASEHAGSVYRRLGFEPVGPIVRFRR